MTPVAENKSGASSPALHALTKVSGMSKTYRNAASSTLSSTPELQRLQSEDGYGDASKPRSTTKLRRSAESYQRRTLRSCRGQSTVEYLIVGLILIVVISTLGVFSNRLQEGLFVQHAADSASHAITSNTAGSAGDILLY